MTQAAAPVATDRRLTREQRSTVMEFCKTYGFTSDQIGFDGREPDPIFDFDSLSVLSVELCDVPHIEVSMGAFDFTLNLAVADGFARLRNGNTRKIFGSAFIGEILHDGSMINSNREAINIARARALRAILRTVGFDPVKSHEAAKRGATVLELKIKSPRQNQLAECHIIAERLGFIKREAGHVDRSEYDRLMATYFEGETSTGALKERPLFEWLTMLRLWDRKERSA